MEHLKLLSPFAGRIEPRRFAQAALAVYAALLLSQVLTVPAVMQRIGVWPFVIVQAALLWVWFTLHARRLRDAGYGLEPAAAIGVIAALALVLLLVAVAFYVDPASGEILGEDARRSPTTFAGYVTRFVLDALGSLSSAGVAGVMLLLLVLAACAPAPIALAFSVWAFTRTRAVASGGEPEPA